MQNKKGFTLIELMIVVAIIAILAMIAVPMYQRYIERARNSAAQAVLTQASTAMVAYSVDFNTFLPAGAINSTDTVANALALFGFRPDSNVGIQFLNASGGYTGFIMYAAHRASGSRLYVYDNINSSGVQPMGNLTTLWDPTTSALSSTVANTACTSPLDILLPGTSIGNYTIDPVNTVVIDGTTGLVQ